MNPATNPSADEQDSQWISEVRDRYRESGLAGRLRPGKSPAVVVVDLQTGFTNPQCGPGFDLDDVVAGTVQLVKNARQANRPVYFTAISFTDAQAKSSVWLSKMPVLSVLRADSGWDEIDPRLAPEPGESVVMKQAASAFAGTNLAEQLRSDEVDTLLICGATTSGCVRASVVDACALELPTFVVRDCVGDREQRPHDGALLDMDAKYADVVSLDDALEIIGAAP
ncbi:isochorismatase family protein [Arthrobacter sp. NPDC055138]